MTNRDAIDCDVVAFAVTDYLCSFRGNAAQAKFIATLVSQGVMTPDEASEVCVETPDADPSRVDVFIRGGVTVLMVDDSGNVSNMRL